jgi:acyl-CoA thioesterase FadM
MTDDELASGPPADGRHATNDAPKPRGDVLVAALTEWAFVDTETGRPRRVPIEVIAEFLVAAGE